MENSPIAISPEFNFQSRYAEVHGSKMHYIDEGEGDPILFLHGNPTSSYLWRNIIPYLVPHARCIAPDLIGMGKSDKPDLDYRFFDHVKYLEGFIEQLGLKNITLVIHDWGSGLGFHYATRHQNNVKGIAFMEAIIAPAKWSQFPKDFKLAFKMMRTSYVGWFMISGLNMFVNKILPMSVVRKLTKEEMAYYREPYPSANSRLPLRQWPREIPIEGHPADVHDAVSTYNKILQEWEVPKLLFYAHPGGLITKKQVAWCKENFPNLNTVDIGKGLHFVQEDNPHQIGEELSKWYLELV